MVLLVLEISFSLVGQAVFCIPNAGGVWPQVGPSQMDKIVHK